MTSSYNTVIIGAGAAGMHCAAQSIISGRTLLIDHAKAPGEKIRISGGGRCNFTNLHCRAENFISQNPHFIKSSLAGYSQQDFIDLVQSHGIAYHQKTMGQLFCDGSAKAIIQMLADEMRGTDLRLNTSVTDCSKTENGFHIALDSGDRIDCRNLVIATGGKSIPKMGATGFGYQIARQFGLRIIETRPGLVPLTFSENDLAFLKPLAGLALDVSIRSGKTSFQDAMLFTHRGLSGPAVLQISNYWRHGDVLEIDLLPNAVTYERLRAARQKNGKRALSRVLSDDLPNRLAAGLCEMWGLTGNIGDQSDRGLKRLSDQLHHWRLKPTGSEGYRTAEVTLGGVDTKTLNAATMACKSVPGLYFIGEVVDVTGWLGGYNFQWAWSSGYAAGTAIAEKA